MNAWFPVLKARTVFLFSAMLVAAGAAPVLYFVALLVWQIAVLFQTKSWVPLPATLVFTDHSTLQAANVAPVLAFIPELPSALVTNRALAWSLGMLHAGLVPALLGCGIVALGVLGVLRQKTAIRITKQRIEDRLRRVRDYRREVGGVDGRRELFDGRREPFDGRREPFISSRPAG